MTSFHIGQRLSCDGSLCTVRYQGPVKGTKGDWLGVEWDDPLRGKHSGEHGGVRYFECVRKHPTAGLFIRPNRPLDSPRTFVQALKEKYGSTSELENGVAVNKSPWDTPVRISGKEVEEVGFDKIIHQMSQLHELRIVILDTLRISRPLSPRLLENWKLPADQRMEDELLTDVKRTCPKILDLDLSRNVFEDWREVISICEQLPQLKALKSDGNRFRTTGLGQDMPLLLENTFRSLKSLSLDDTLLPWEDLATIISYMPCLESLSVASNDFKIVSWVSPTASITELNLEDNQLESLSSLKTIAESLSNLRKLKLKMNKISRVADFSTFSSFAFPPTLTDVDLSYNQISSWTFIDAISDVFPGLSSLRVSHNPLYSTLHSPDGRPLSADDGYMLTLARFANLKVLNFSTITSKERLNAEMYYLSSIAKELSLNPENKAGDIIATHRRWRELCEEHGDPTIARTTENLLNPNSLAARLMKIKFHLGDKGNVQQSANADAGTPVAREITMEIPKSFSMYNVLGMVGKRFGLNPRKIKLVWETGEVEDTGEDEYDSADSEEETQPTARDRTEVRFREVEMTASTRPISSLVDGNDASVRVEMLQQ